jgi:hypothetical protein
MATGTRNAVDRRRAHPRAVLLQRGLLRGPFHLRAEDLLANLPRPRRVGPPHGAHRLLRRVATVRPPGAHLRAPLLRHAGFFPARRLVRCLPRAGRHRHHQLVRRRPRRRVEHRQQRGNRHLRPRLLRGAGLTAAATTNRADRLAGAACRAASRLPADAPTPVTTSATRLRLARGAASLPAHHAAAVMPGVTVSVSLPTGTTGTERAPAGTTAGTATTHAEGPHRIVGTVEAGETRAIGLVGEAARPRAGGTTRRRVGVAETAGCGATASEAGTTAVGAGTTAARGPHGAGARAAAPREVTRIAASAAVPARLKECQCLLDRNFVAVL